jgi:aminomethyltransferase
MQEAGIARHGYAVVSETAEPIGVVTSGTRTPHLNASIGLAYVPPALGTPGTDIAIDIRGRAARARVVPLPFYRRAAGSPAPGR